MVALLLRYMPDSPHILILPLPSGAAVALSVRSMAITSCTKLSLRGELREDVFTKEIIDFPVPRYWLKIPVFRLQYLTIFKGTRRLPSRDREEVGVQELMQLSTCSRILPTCGSNPFASSECQFSHSTDAWNFAARQIPVQIPEIIFEFRQSFTPGSGSLGMPQNTQAKTPSVANGHNAHFS